jgi:DNA-directed RNA polymerase specialized sigma24 family protein
MTGDGSVTHWLYQLKQGDSASAQQLWNRYFQRLLAVAARKLGDRHLVSDAEDVALGALASFFVRARAGQFPQLADRSELWPLLVKITACKAYGELERAGAQKRGGLSRAVPLFESEGSSAGGAELAGDEPTPEFAAQVAEECGLLLGKLADPLLVRIAELKLTGYTNAEIADQLELCERSIERKLNCIRAKWSEESGE